MGLLPRPGRGVYFVCVRAGSVLLLIPMGPAPPAAAWYPGRVRGPPAREQAEPGRRRAEQAFGAEREHAFGQGLTLQAYLAGRDHYCRRRQDAYKARVQSAEARADELERRVKVLFCRGVCVRLKRSEGTTNGGGLSVGIFRTLRPSSTRPTAARRTRRSTSLARSWPRSALKTSSARSRCGSRRVCVLSGVV